MSRSYKKTPVCKDGNKSKKEGKFWANKKIRRSKDLRMGVKSNLYKKAYEQWDVCDYRCYVECKVNAEKEELNWWKKWYVRK